MSAPPPPSKPDPGVQTVYNPSVPPQDPTNPPAPSNAPSQNALVSKTQSEGFKPPAPGAPEEVGCYRCQNVVVPVWDTSPTWKTHIFAGLLFLCGIPFVAFLPYCFDCFGRPVLRCPICGCYMVLPVH